MGSLMILDRNPLERQFIIALTNGQYEPVIETCDVNIAVKAIGNHRKRPELIVAAFDPKPQDTLLLLRWLYSTCSSIPVVVIARSSMARELEPMARSLGFRVFVHDPADPQELAAAMQEAVRPPPASPDPETTNTDEEEDQNLTALVDHLNAIMQCPTGREQLFLHAFTEFGQDARPRVCLRCPIRAAVGMTYDVYYKHIRDVCCAAPERCEAMQTYGARAIYTESRREPRAATSLAARGGASDTQVRRRWSRQIPESWRRRPNLSAP